MTLVKQGTTQISCHLEFQWTVLEVRKILLLIWGSEVHSPVAKTIAWSYLYFLQSGHKTNKRQHFSGLYQHLFHAHTSFLSLNLKVWSGWGSSIHSCKLDSDILYLLCLLGLIAIWDMHAFLLADGRSTGCRELTMLPKPAAEKRHTAVFSWTKRITWELTMG